MLDKVRTLLRQYDEVQARLASSEGLSAEELRVLTKRHAELKPAAILASELQKVERDLEAARQILEGPDRDLHDLAEAERRELLERRALLERETQVLLLPRDPREGRNVFLEVRAGAGGDEAALFAAQLVRLYMYFAQGRGWKAEVVELSPTGLKGAKAATLFIKGTDAYGWLRFEAGVHRVQRVPQTEASGRIHTSTCTVAVLPETEEVEVKIDPKDLRIDTFRAGGHGGQNVQKNETAIRITHLPTGVVVQCQDERSQGQNKEKGMKVLRAKLAALAEEARSSGVAQERRSQVGTGERSEKIRTYNFPQNRVTDHRLKESWHNLPALLEGRLDPVLEALRKDALERSLERSKEGM